VHTYCTQVLKLNTWVQSYERFFSDVSTFSAEHCLHSSIYLFDVWNSLVLGRFTLKLQEVVHFFNITFFLAENYRLSTYLYANYGHLKIKSLNGSFLSANGLYRCVRTRAKRHLTFNSTSSLNIYFKIDVEITYQRLQ